MGKRSPISATMVACIEMARCAGGELVRYQGGYWAPRSSARRSHDGLPVAWHGTSTVQAIVDRGEAEYCDWRDHGRQTGRFPIAIRLVEQGA